MHSLLVLEDKYKPTTDVSKVGKTAAIPEETTHSKLY